MNRTVALRRRTALQPGQPLTRSPMPPRDVSLPRSRGRSITASRAGNFPAAESPAPKGKSAAARNSGPTPKVRRLVLERDDYTCQCGCLRSVIGQRYSLGHRLRASQGGKPVASNLLTFLGWGGEQCHGRIDNRDDPRDEANGMTVRSGTDPALVRVTLTLLDGSKVERYLWDDGTRRDYPQSAVAA